MSSKTLTPQLRGFDDHAMFLLSEEPKQNTGKGPEFWVLLLSLLKRSFRYLCTNLHAFMHFMVPSFLRASSKPPPLNAIASLDGLRGYASFGVFTLHFTDTFCQMHNRGWGFDEWNHYPIQLPFVHAFWNANALVACFFVVSGYVLAHKPLRQLRAREHEALLRTLSSAAFRRGIRLYAPTVPATFVAFVFVRLGAFNYSHWVWSQGYTAAGEDTPPIFPTFAEQFVDWRDGILGMLFPFRWGGGAPGYDPHLWTIPMEFQGSMLLFFVVLGTSRLRTGVRMGGVGALVLYMACYGLNDLLLFFGGMLLAETDLILRTPACEKPGLLKRLRWFWIGCFVAGWYLVGMPTWDPGMTPGYKTILWLYGTAYHWHALGCFLMVTAARNCEEVQPLFTNRFAQYLGRVSFSLYIVHGNVRRTVTYALMPALLWLTNGRESRMGYGVTVLLNAAVTYAITFVLADAWWRAVDLPSIRLARWLEEKAVSKEE